MIRRIWVAYTVECAKAIRLRFTYVGPVLVVFTVLCTAVVAWLQQQGMAGYVFVAYATSMTLNLPGLLFLLGYCAGLVSTELGGGTICMVLVRPLRRWEYLVAKLGLGMTYALVLVGATAGTSWAVALFQGHLSGVIYGGEVAFTAGEMGKAYVLGMLLSLLPQSAAVAYAVMISTCTRSTGAAVGGAIGIWIVCDTLKYPLRIDTFLFSSYLETPWRVFADQCNALEGLWLPEAFYCAVTSLVSLAVFMGVAFFLLHRRNLNA